MREAIRGLASRCPVVIVSGRERQAVQELMGVDDLVFADSHGFDIWKPAGGTIQREEGAGFEELLDEVKERLGKETSFIEGALLEPKKTSVAVHYRLVSEEERQRIKETVDALLAEHPDELKVTVPKQRRRREYMLSLIPSYLQGVAAKSDRYAPTLGRGLKARGPSKSRCLSNRADRYILPRAMNPFLSVLRAPGRRRKTPEGPTALLRDP